MGDRSAVWRVLGSAFVAAALLFALASNALAARPYVSQLTGTALTSPSGVAVDDSDNVWVSDVGSSLVSKFDSSGTYTGDQNDGTGSWGSSIYIQDLAFGSSAGLMYVADSNNDDLWGLNLDATFAGVDLNLGIGGCCFIQAAVDNSGTATDGDIYVTAVSTSVSSVTRIDGSGAAANFSASASYISGNQLTGTPDQAFGTPKGVAVDASGNIYVVDQGNAEVYEFASSGTFVTAIPVSGTLTDVAVDPTNGNILVGDSGNGLVHELTSTGTPVENIDGSATPAGSFSPQGIAVDSTGRVYVVDSAHAVVDVFGATPPTHLLTVSKSGAGAGVVTSSPAGITCGVTCSASFDEHTSVTLTAAPVSGSTFTGWSGPDAGSCPGTGTCNVTVDADASVTATFAPLPPTVTTTAGATGITQHAATVAGTVNPRSHTVTNCHIEYGTSTSYGSQVPCSPAAPGSGSTAVAVTGAISGLAASTTYHFRVVATNSGGTTNGSDQTFKTLADTCATNAALCPKPKPTCATDPSLCPPPPTAGVLKLDVAVAAVSGGKAALKLSCAGETACSGTLTLTAKIKVRKGRKHVTKTVTLGKATVSIAAGGSATVKVKLNRTARRLLAKKPRLKATLSGMGLKHTVVLKGKAKKKHKKR